MPCTAAPGGVLAEHRYTPDSGVAHGCSDSVGLHELHEARVAAGYVAADDVRVMLLHGDGVVRGPRQDDVPEARREPLDLVLDRRGHVHGRAVRHVAVGP